MNSNEGVRSIHCMGVGGVGVATLARHFLHQGYRVSGCDVHDTTLTRELKKEGVSFFLGHSSHHIMPDTERVIYSDAIPHDHEELEYARSRGVSVTSYAQALGEVTSLYRTIGVAGTNGKSTTTSLIGLICAHAGLDPTVVVGGTVNEWEGGYRAGDSEYCIAEADEYNKHFLELHPESIVITNIEAEHLDVYAGIGELQETFIQFLHHATDKGYIILNADDPVSNEVRKRISHANILTYGTDEHADMRLVERSLHDGVQECKCMYKEEELNLRIHVPGLFNVYNVMAAATCALAYGVSLDSIVEVIDSFKGIGRRFERIGAWHGAEVISDYAHHPTSVAATLHAAREFFPNRRIIGIFQPHQHARTRLLKDEFIRALSSAESLILMEVYGVVGREEGEHISSKDLITHIHGPSPLHYALDIHEVKTLLEKEVHEGDVLVFMGAGNIDKGVRDYFIT